MHLFDDLELLDAPCGGTTIYTPAPVDDLYATATANPPLIKLMRNAPDDQRIMQMPMRDLYSVNANDIAKWAASPEFLHSTDSDSNGIGTTESEPAAPPAFSTTPWLGDGFSDTAPLGPRTELDVLDEPT